MPALCDQRRAAHQSSERSRDTVSEVGTSIREGRPLLKQCRERQPDIRTQRARPLAFLTPRGRTLLTWLEVVGDHKGRRTSS